MTAGIVGFPVRSQVLRNLWRISKQSLPQGTGGNAKPDWQQIWTQADVVVWVDRGDETGVCLEDRVRAVLVGPEAVSRFGGWCLGESTHLINDLWVLEDARPPAGARVFVQDDDGDMTLPVWVDHVGFTDTRYAVGTLAQISDAPAIQDLPRIGRGQ